jgi:DNA-3-methyladenine glycosylase II
MSEVILRHLATADAVMAGVIRAAGPYRRETESGCQPFQILAQAIAHQQLNGTAANTILRRLIETCGAGTFPTPEQVLAAPAGQLRAAGFSFAKVAALKDLAARSLSAEVPDRATLEQLDDEAIVARLTQVRGVGRWTVEMLLIFHLDRQDVLPVDDFGVRAGFRAAYGLRALPHPRALAAWGERWRPYRSAAAWYLWRALELARAGTLPAPAERVRLPRVERRRRAKPRRAPRRGTAARGGTARKRGRVGKQRAGARGARAASRTRPRSKRQGRRTSA